MHLNFCKVKRCEFVFQPECLHRQGFLLVLPSHLQNLFGSLPQPPLRCLLLTLLLLALVGLHGATPQSTCCCGASKAPEWNFSVTDPAEVRSSPYKHHITLSQNKISSTALVWSTRQIWKRTCAERTAAPFMQECTACYTQWRNALRCATKPIQCSTLPDKE